MKQPNIFGDSLMDMIKGLTYSDKQILRRAATSFDNIIESNSIPRNFEYLTTLYAALCYDIANEPHDAHRLYKSLFSQTQQDFSNIVLSQIHSKRICESIAHFGLREYNHFNRYLDEITRHLVSKKEFSDFHLEPEFEDDYFVFMSIMNLLKEFSSSVTNLNSEESGNVLSNAAKFHSSLENFYPNSWVENLTVLFLELIKSVSERSILSLNLSEKMKQILVNRNVTELWSPQIDAVSEGLLRGNNFVYSSPPGTGKSFLAYVSIGQLQLGMQAVYLVPTKSLSTQVFDDLKSLKSIMTQINSSFNFLLKPQSTF